MPVPTSASPPPAEPEKLRVNGVVREVYVPPLAPPVRTGSLAEIPFDNAREDPDAVVLSRKCPVRAADRPGPGPGAGRPGDGRADGGRTGGGWTGSGRHLPGTGPGRRLLPLGRARTGSGAGAGAGPGSGPGAGSAGRPGDWQDVTATAFAAEVHAVAKGLIAHGLRPGDRLAIMSRTTYEWTLLDFAAWAAGLVTVPIYPTSSAFQTRWILQDSGAVACVVEDAHQQWLIGQERERLPGLAHLWVFDGGAVETLCAAGADVPDRQVAKRRTGLGPESVATICYTSGTTGRPRGCVLTHGNFFAEVDNAIELLYPVFKSADAAAAAEAAGAAHATDGTDTTGTTGNARTTGTTDTETTATSDRAGVTSDPGSAPGDAGSAGAPRTAGAAAPGAGLSTLLFLPLAHVFGRMVAIGCLRARVRLGHAPSLKTDDLLADLATFRPTFLLAVPYVMERVYNTARATAERMGRAASFDRAAKVAQEYGEATEAALRGTGPGPALPLRAARALYDPLVYRRVRAALGGRVRHVICGGSPLGRRLTAFYLGAGITTFEGYGLTETTAAATVIPPHRPRMGTVGPPLPGTAVRIADDGEILLRGGQVFGGYWDGERGEAVLPHGPGDSSRTEPTGENASGWSDGWLATGDLGSLDEDGYLTLTGRKKDVIITSSGKNVIPAPLEDWLRAHPLVSQCMVLGDNRSYVTALITLEPEGLAHWRLMKRKQHIPMRALADDPDLRGSLQRAIDEANRLVSRAESIRRFRVLPVDFTEEAGHLTPSLKMRRQAIARDFAAEIESLYRA
ncbi:AMP-dependent synthetase/ligase [Streptomyces hebeiensis]